MVMIPRQLCSYLSLAILVVPVFLLPPLASSDILSQSCVNGWNYTANSTYQSNLKLLSTELPKKASSSPTHLFAADSAGTVPDTVYGLTLCRGDTTNASDCAACVANAFRDAQQVCPYVMDVTVYYDPCYLRFSYQNFLASIDNSKQYINANGENVTTSPAAAFDAAVGVLLGAVVDYAVRNSSSRFGTGVVDHFDESNPNIYALAQCTPDLSPDDCRACLDQRLKVQLKFFSGRQGGRILGLRCNYRFELYPLFSGSPLLHLAVAAPGPAVTASVDTGESH
jgi:hypothetical protein